MFPDFVRSQSSSAFTIHFDISHLISELAFYLSPGYQKKKRKKKKKKKEKERGSEKKKIIFELKKFYFAGSFLVCFGAF